MKVIYKSHSFFLYFKVTYYLFIMADYCQIKLFDHIRSLHMSVSMQGPCKLQVTLRPSLSTIKWNRCQERTQPSARAQQRRHVSSLGNFDSEWALNERDLPLGARFSPQWRNFYSFEFTTTRTTKRRYSRRLVRLLLKFLAPSPGEAAPARGTGLILLSSFFLRIHRIQGTLNFKRGTLSHVMGGIRWVRG